MSNKTVLERANAMVAVAARGLTSSLRESGQANHLAAMLRAGECVLVVQPNDNGTLHLSVVGPSFPGLQDMLKALESAKAEMPPELNNQP